MSSTCSQCQFENSEEAIFCLKCDSPLKSSDNIHSSQTKTLDTNRDEMDSSSLFAARYRLVGELGQGGMGVVYKAEDTRLKRQVALKFLPKEFTSDPEAKKRFEREAQAAAALDHPNICTVHEIDEAEGKIFISMAYVRGQSLKEKLSSGSLGLDQSIPIALQVAYGLREAHDKNIVHRDIKPANIMLTDKGQVKVMDFGIAKRDSGDDLTKPATIMGTVAYMSPEQAKGKTVDHRTDIWSFGVVFYEMLTGKSPFKGGHEQATIHAILNEDPEPITDSHFKIPKRAEKIIDKCLEKDPSERYKNAEGLIKDLGLLVKESGVEGMTDQLLTGYKKSKKTHFIYAASVVIVCVLVAVLGYIFISSGNKDTTPAKPRLVVLPFENLGPANDEYFADGMTEEITNRLAKISSLGVISRTSAVHYAGTDKTIQQIGNELDVDYVLEGTVRWMQTPDGQGRVKITPQLIQVADDTHIWADSFDRIFEDIFDIQNDIAQIVVEKLGLTLLDTEQEAVVSRPTENVEAYQAFLRGRHLAGRPHYTQENWIQVIQSFQQAVNLDPEFGPAYAELAKAHARFYYLRSDLSEERLHMARSAAEKAMELSPDSPEVHLALSYYFLWAQRDNARALEELKKAEEYLPENPEILSAKASILELLGQFEEGIEVLKTAFELNPLDVWIPNAMAGFYWITRQYPLALDACNRAIELGPEEPWTYIYKILNYWSWKGAIKESRAVAEAMPQDHSWALWIWFWQEVGEGKYQAALERLSQSSSEWISLKTWARPVVMFEAFVYDYLNDAQKARSAYETAKTMLEEEVLKQPDDPRMHSSLGVAYAALGFKDIAVQQGKIATELLPYSENPLYGICFVQDLGLIYLLTGEYETSLDQIEFLLSVHSWVSIPFLELNPHYKRLQDHPRYQDLVKKYSDQ